MRQGTDEWLVERSHGIGGSDIAAVLGLSKYRTPRDVWLDKTGRSQSSMNEAMDWGHRLEPVVLGRFAEQHGEVETYPLLPGIHTHRSVPVAKASLDGMLRLPDGTGQPVDAKTSRYGWDELPPDYVIQLQWQMGITETTHGWVAALIGGSSYTEYSIPFQKELFEDALEFAQRFWRDHVLTDVEPDPTRDDDLNTVFHPEAGLQVDIPESLWKAYRVARDSESGATKWRKMVEDDLKLMIGDATEVTVNGELVATWRARKGSVTVDRKQLETEWPDAFAAVSKQGEGTRTWLVK